MLQIIIVEDNEKVREGLKILLNGTDGFSCVGAYGDCESMLKEIQYLDPDIALMDIGLPGMSGIEGIKKLRKKNPDLIILVLTIHEEDDLVFEALCAGASGYLLKQTSPSHLIEALKEAEEGGAPMSSNIARKVVNSFQNMKPRIEGAQDYSLTVREREVLSGLVDGKNCRAIADHLFISVETVRFHFRNIYRKLHVKTQAEVVAKVLKENLL